MHVSEEGAESEEGNFVGDEAEEGDDVEVIDADRRAEPSSFAMLQPDDGAKA